MKKPIKLCNMDSIGKISYFDSVICDICIVSQLLNGVFLWVDMVRFLVLYPINIYRLSYRHINICIYIIFIVFLWTDISYILHLHLLLLLTPPLLEDTGNTEGAANGGVGIRSHAEQQKILFAKGVMVGLNLT